MISIGRTANKGRGVFAQTHIAARALIEEAPVIVIAADQIEPLRRTVLRYYYFEWGPDDTEGALVLGAFSLCNHSYQPNAVYVRNPERMTIAFFALRDIAPGEEITTNYHGEPDSQAPIWFPLAP